MYDRTSQVRNKQKYQVGVVIIPGSGRLCCTLAAVHTSHNFRCSLELPSRCFPSQGSLLRQYPFHALPWRSTDKRSLNCRIAPLQQHAAQYRCAILSNLHEWLRYKTSMHTRGCNCTHPLGTTSGRAREKIQTSHSAGLWQHPGVFGRHQFKVSMTLCDVAARNIHP